MQLPHDKARTLAQIEADFAKGPIKIGPTEEKILREIINEVDTKQEQK